MSPQHREWLLKGHSTKKAENRCSNPMRLCWSDKVEEACRHSRPEVWHSSSVLGLWHLVVSVLHLSGDVDIASVSQPLALLGLSF